MGQVEVFLGLGSNLGNREDNLRRALDLVGERIAIERTSSLYDTAPWGYLDQPRFLNCACSGSTSLRPLPLLKELKGVERQLGREPGFANGPRLIDVDILFYGREIISEPSLEVPHPRLAERAFVLVPLAEIAPDCLHPVTKTRVSELLQWLAGGPGEALDAVVQGVTLWAPPIPVGGDL